MYYRLFIFISHLLSNHSLSSEDFKKFLKFKEGKGQRSCSRLWKLGQRSWSQNLLLCKHRVRLVLSVGEESFWVKGQLKLDSRIAPWAYCTRVLLLSRFIVGIKKKILSVQKSCCQIHCNCPCYKKNGKATPEDFLLIHTTSRGRDKDHGYNYCHLCRDRYFYCTTSSPVFSHLSKVKLPL
ncbi:hypothetical protein H5410_008808, partial [Solanum commersonii]